MFIHVVIKPKIWFGTSEIFSMWDFGGLKVCISQFRVSPFCPRSKHSDYTGNDVLGGSTDISIMAENGRKKGGSNYCSASGPNLANCDKKTGTLGISMHYFPTEESLRDKWTRFVRRHGKDFIPKKRLSLCSVHFEESCFEHKPVLVQTDDGQTIELKRNLIKVPSPRRIRWSY